MSDLIQSTTEMIKRVKESAAVIFFVLFQKMCKCFNDDITQW